MNPSELSKKKYVWRYYIGSDGIIHKDRCPVIYLNINFIYYKSQGGAGEPLSQRSTRDVIGNEAELRSILENKLANKNRCGDTISWIETDITQYQRNVEEIKRQAEIREWSGVVEHRRIWLQDAIDHLEQLKKKEKLDE